jgi:hypothetical protein
MYNNESCLNTILVICNDSTALRLITNTANPPTGLTQIKTHEHGSIRYENKIILVLNLHREIIFFFFFFWVWPVKMGPTAISVNSVNAHRAKTPKPQKQNYLTISARKFHFFFVQSPHLNSCIAVVILQEWVGTADH